jgi:hypothetical protein
MSVPRVLQFAAREKTAERAVFSSFGRTHAAAAEGRFDEVREVACILHHIV